MKLTARVTWQLAEIKVDEIDTMLFKSNPEEVQEFIFMLISVAEDIATLTDKTLHDHMNDYYIA